MDAAAAAANIGSATCCCCCFFFSWFVILKRQRTRRTLNAILQMASVQVLFFFFLMNSISAFSPNCINCALPTASLLPSSETGKNGGKKRERERSLPRVCSEIDANILEKQELSAVKRGRRTKQSRGKIYDHLVHRSPAMS